MASIYKGNISIPSSFSSLEEYDNFLKDVIEKSNIDFKTSLNDNDRLIVLYSTDNIILIGKLIKISYY